MPENELSPWVVVHGQDEARSLAMWRLADVDEPALALFSDSTRAEEYATTHIRGDWRVTQPARSALLGIMIECYQQQVRLAVLDPDEAGARRIFKLRDVLKAAREELR